MGGSGGGGEREQLEKRERRTFPGRLLEDPLRVKGSAFLPSSLPIYSVINLRLTLLLCKQNHPLRETNQFRGERKCKGIARGSSLNSFAAKRTWDDQGEYESSRVNNASRL